MLNTMGQTSATNRIVLKVVKGQLNPMPVQCVTTQTLKKTKKATKFTFPIRIWSL